MRDILPAAVHVHELRKGIGYGSHPVLPAEEPFVVGAAIRRRQEFAAVRHCARQGLSALGLPSVPVRSDSRGAPVWPDGVVGSMTHIAGYCAAAVATAGEFCAVGIDAESHRRLPTDVIILVCSEAERQHVRRLAAAVPHVSWEVVVFSAKESAYKTWYPLTLGWLDYDDVAIQIDPGRRRFIARVLVGPRPLRLAGRFAVDGATVLTAIALTRGTT